MVSSPRLPHSLGLFLSKDMMAWTDLCADVVAEFPFVPEGS